MTQVVQKCKAARHPHLGKCVFEEVVEPVKSVAKLSGRELAAVKSAPITDLDNAKAGSSEEARDLLARAVANLALQRPSLRRLRKLMRSEDDKVASGAWEQIMAFLKVSRDAGGSGKPVQIQFVNYIPRPE